LAAFLIEVAFPQREARYTKLPVSALDFHAEFHADAAGPSGLGLKCFCTDMWVVVILKVCLWSRELG
jgi:hypothetical protein